MCRAVPGVRSGSVRCHSMPTNFLRRFVMALASGGLLFWNLMEMVEMIYINLAYFVFLIFAHGQVLISVMLTSSKVLNI